ncbi:hypothetical protein [Geminicoccus harenae]|uniref:hypothetical protein n=1 Tax=Geminicoccus harenae TaxID=2498453 RepID=UPI00168BFB5F|nr:hypothetical protein [Geminicoccus harenae]
MSRAITAIFATRAAAERARDSIVALGVAPDAVLVRGGEDREGGADHGFWRNLFETFIPHSEHPSYLEGMRAGSFVVAAEVPEAQVAAVERLLDDQGSCVAGGAGCAVGSTMGSRVRSYGRSRQG